MNGAEEIWFDRPAEVWNEALPLGNGRLGAMVFGQTDEERIGLNEDSLWAWEPGRRAPPATPADVQTLRRHLAEGRLDEANHLMRTRFTASPRHLAPYQPLGELRLSFRGQGAVRYDMRPDATGIPVMSRRMGSDLHGYRRNLDLARGIAEVTYGDGAGEHRRTCFASNPDQVVVLRLQAARPGGLHLVVQLFRRPFDPGTSAGEDGALVMAGRSGAIGFAAVVQVQHRGGRRTVIGDQQVIEGADEVLLLVAAATTFRVADPEAEARQWVARAAALGYDALEARHVADHAALFGRVALHLPARHDPAAPTDVRVARARAEGDPSLAALLYQYGRYLLIASSRPGSLPANLQGIWNDSFIPPWESKFTLNLNLPMNYWHAESGALGECHLALVEFVERLAENGRVTARDLYGCRGFCAHHNAGLMAETEPEGQSLLACLWPLGGAWLALHLADHARYAGDRHFLETRAYPILREAALFCRDFLMERPDGRLISGPSLSPENWYTLPNGAEGALCLGPAMDHQIMRALFAATCAAARDLGRDPDLVADLENAAQRLVPDRINADGRLAEWSGDEREVELGHRHLSHLFALCPGWDITPRATPELARAAQASLEFRLAHGSGGTGWSRAWSAACWARLADGDQAWAEIRAFLTGSVQANLLCTHPPFQIDGSFGISAAIADLLLLARPDGIDLLPGLPSAWSEGEVRGLRAPGGLEVDLTWRSGQLERARLRAHRPGRWRLILPDDRVLEVDLVADEEWILPTCPSGLGQADTGIPKPMTPHHPVMGKAT